MSKLRIWLTDNRRQAIHALLATFGTIAVTFGYVTESQTGVALIFAGVVLQSVQGILGLTLLSASGAARWFNTVGRGLVYALAAAAGPLGLAFEWWGADVSATIITVTSLGLTAFSAFLAVVNVQTVPATDGIPLTRAAAKAIRAEANADRESNEGGGGVDL